MENVILWIFLIACTLSWGIAEIYYKKGNLEKEKYSHLKTSIFVGFFFGAYALVITIIQSVQDINFLKFLPINMLIYLPVALCYLVSMTCSYFGVRFIEESISDPIENTSGAIVPILCAIFLHETIDSPWIIVAIVIIAVGLICVGFFDKEGRENRHKKYGKKLAIWAFAMPFCYMLLDATGTFLDIFYTEDAASSILRGFGENAILDESMLEHMANCCYQYIFFIVAIGLYIFIRLKGEKLFSLGNQTDENGNLITTDGLKWYKKVWLQRDKLLAAFFETAGQATYLFALSEGTGIAAVILGAGTVICSLILSRVFLKEKLTLIQYVFIFIIMAGIIFLAVMGG